MAAGGIQIGMQYGEYGLVRTQVSEKFGQPDAIRKKGHQTEQTANIPPDKLVRVTFHARRQDG